MISDKYCIVQYQFVAIKKFKKVSSFKENLTIPCLGYFDDYGSLQIGTCIVTRDHVQLTFVIDVDEEFDFISNAGSIWNTASMIRVSSLIGMIEH